MEGLSRNGRRWMKLMGFGARLGCHQRPDRSFFFKKYQFPVCARCTGVILGELAAILHLLLGGRIKKRSSVLLLIPMGVDWGLQNRKILESTNTRRLISGTLGGYGLTFVFFYALKALLYDLPRKLFQKKDQ